MRNLESIFDEAQVKKQNSHNEYVEKCRAIWNSYLEGAKQAYEELKFLNNKGLRIELVTCEAFTYDLYLKGHLPKVSFQNTTIDIKKEQNEDFISVSSIGKFSLMGEKHTYESFLKKLLS